MGRGFWLFLGGMAAGAVGATIVYSNRDKIKPMAANLLAKGMNLKNKTVEYAAKAKEHAEDVVAEAKNISSS